MQPYTHFGATNYSAIAFMLGATTEGRVGETQDVTFSICDADVKLTGTTVSLVDTALQSIELASDDSIPQKVNFRKEAAAVIVAAVRRLLRDDTPFVTVLKDTWVHPAVVWKLK